MLESNPYSRFGIYPKDVLHASGLRFISSLEKAKIVVAASVGLPSKTISECYALIGLAVRIEMSDRNITQVHVTPHTLSKAFKNCGLPKPASRLMTPGSTNNKAFSSVMYENHELAVIPTHFGTLMFIDIAAVERSAYTVFSTTSMQTRLNYILDALSADKIKSSSICVLSKDAKGSNTELLEEDEDQDQDIEVQQRS